MTLYTNEKMDIEMLVFFCYSVLFLKELQNTITKLKNIPNLSNNLPRASNNRS